MHVLVCVSIGHGLCREAAGHPPTRPLDHTRPLQIATVLAMEKQGPAALESLEAANAAAAAAGGASGLIQIPTAYKR